MLSRLLKRSVFAMLLAVLPALAEDPAKPEKLAAGAKAPPLTVEKWVKGAPVANFEAGKIYVVEFWATWCGPCISSMPHLSDLQKQFGAKGVTIIGCSSQDPRNSLEKVETMVKEKGDGMGYTVAWDTGRTTYEAYMKAAGQNGIPCSFVVDQKSNIAWIGHPMFLDMVLEPLTAGKWDPKTGAESIAKAEKAMDEVFSTDDPKAVIAAFEKFEKDYPSLAHDMRDQLFGAYLKAGDYDKAYKLANEVVEKAVKGKNAMKLNDIAWTIVDPQGDVAKKDLDLALKAATKADELSGGKEAAIIDTLARVYFVKGDVKKAIELQTKAVELAEGRMKDELQKALDEYKAKGKKE
ncbi:Thiol-disulfide oxidoreductase ResA [Phycisphaerae bacterium RAS1]|nr:Thiol-disulfide oxidoreductase ResA [Phycisphaerae bacterium RAS1]